MTNFSKLSIPTEFKFSIGGYMGYLYEFVLEMDDLVFHPLELDMSLGLLQGLLHLLKIGKNSELPLMT